MEKVIQLSGGRLHFRETLQDRVEYEWYLAQQAGLGS